MLMKGISLILLKLFFRWQKGAPKMLEADSFDHNNTFRVPSTMNEIAEADINEVTQGSYDKKHGSKYGDKQHHYKGKRDFDKKPWQNKDQ